MPVKQIIPYNSGTLFITFTCHDWLSLIDRVNGYDIVYNWFDHLKSKGHYINGYVIMPNHIHSLISFVKCTQKINTIIGNGKRFMAYEIINRLKNNNEVDLLQLLSDKVGLNGIKKQKIHEVWEPSFDWKDCRSWEFICQKLDYMHDNPRSGKWRICISPDEYLHSSAKYYLTGKQGIYKVSNYMEMEDVEFELR